MAARYQVRLKSQSGSVVAVLTNWRSLEYTLRVNATDSHVFTIDGESAVVPSFALDAQLEVWRRDIAAGIPWYLDYEGFHRTPVDQTNEHGLSTFTSYGRGYDDLIRRREVAYPANSSQTEKTGAGETVIKSYVNENAGPGAVSPPRLLASGVTTGLAMQADGGAGTSWHGHKAYQNLLEAIQDVALVTQVDFKTVGMGPAAFEFQAKAKPWGADRSVVGLNTMTGLNAAGNPPVVFALGFDNMGIPVYSNNRSEEVNAVYVLGQGQEADRMVVLRTDPVAIADSPWNRCEVSRNANMDTDLAGLQSTGDAALEEFASRESFHFSVLQIPSLLYGRNYFIGDLVTARYKTIERNFQITEVRVSVATGREQIDIGVTNV